MKWAETMQSLMPAWELRGVNAGTHLPSLPSLPFLPPSPFFPLLSSYYPTSRPSSLPSPLPHVMLIFFSLSSNLSFSALVREAVQSHHADVVVVDGIRTCEDAQEVCAAVRRGVAVVASLAQCATLGSLHEDSDLRDLLGHGDPSKCVFGILILSSSLLFPLLSPPLLSPLFPPLRSPPLPPLPSLSPLSLLH